MNLLNTVIILCEKPWNTSWVRCEPGGHQRRFLLAGDKECSLVRTAVPRLLWAVLGGQGWAPPPIGYPGLQPGRFFSSLAPLLSCHVLPLLASAEAILSFSTHIHPPQSECLSSQTPLNPTLNCSLGVANSSLTGIPGCSSFITGWPLLGAQVTCFALWCVRSCQLPSSSSWF